MTEQQALIKQRMESTPGDDWRTKVNHLVIKAINSRNCAEHALDIKILAKAYLAEHALADKYRAHVERKARL